MEGGKGREKERKEGGYKESRRLWKEEEEGRKDRVKER